MLTAQNAPRLSEAAEGEFVVLQSPTVSFHGQLIGAVIAESPETAREAAALATVVYDEEAHDSEFRVDHPRSYEPAKVNGGYPSSTTQGDVDTALAAARTAGVIVDEWYSTPEEHNNPMEPHTVVAHWDSPKRQFTLYDSTQSSHAVAATLASAFGLSTEQVHVVSPHVGGGFGPRAARTRTTCSPGWPRRRCPGGM